MKYKNLLLLLAAAAPFAAFASDLTVNSELAGSLTNAVSNPADVTSLTVTGPIDASDMLFIGRSMLNLKSLDLADATIVKGVGGLIDGRTSSPEATIPAGAFAGLPLSSIKFPTEQNITIGETAFMNTAFTEINLPANIDSIGTGAFAGCAELKEVVFPATQRLGSSIFSDCPALTTVTLGATTSIPPATFRNCTALAEVKGSENLVVIANQAFEGTSALQNFTFGPNIKTIGDEAFAASGIQQLAIPAASKITAIGDRSFASSDLSSFEFPASLVTIGHSAFFGAENLVDYEMPATVITIGNHALVGTTLPTAVTLPSSLEEIGDYALNGQKNVQKITLPASLIRIGSYAMEDMTGLKNIYAGALTSVPELGENVWEGVDQPTVTLTVGDDYAEDFKNAPQWQDFNLDLASSRNETMADDVNRPALRGRFNGFDLELESTGADIASVRIFDAAGRLLISTEPRNSKTVVDTSAQPSAVFIINATLSDGSNATLKLSRR